MMQIMDTKPVKPVASAESAGELKVATRVSSICDSTDPTIKSRDRIVKKSEKATCTPPWTWRACGSERNADEGLSSKQRTSSRK